MNGQIKVRSEKNPAGVYISLGSNIGDRMQYLTRAKESLTKEGMKVLKESSIYETEAWGKKDQNSFLNQIVFIETLFDPQSLLKTLLKIEIDLGRHREERFGPRTIDLDILFYKDLVVNEKDLIIPHPEIENRRFVLLPMNEIAPKFLHPLLKKNMRHLSNMCADTSKVTLHLS